MSDYREYPPTFTDGTVLHNTTVRVDRLDLERMYWSQVPWYRRWFARWRARRRIKTGTIRIYGMK